MSTTFRILLLAAGDSRRGHGVGAKAHAAVIIYMAYSIIMSVVWLLLESPTWPSPRPPWARGSQASCSS